MAAASKIDSSRFIKIAGIVKGKIKILPLICVRKNCIRPQLKHTREYHSIVNKEIEVLGMVSHPTLYKSKTAPYITAWCHPYRTPDDFLPVDKPKLLLSESDFVDPKYIYMQDTSKKPKWDYFFFTMGGKKAKKRKGYDVFLKMLPHLCKKGLRGIVINYSYKPLDLNKKERIIWKKSKSFIKYRNKKFSPRRVAKFMSSCKFGIFANTADCSPLLLTESLVRNIPVLVNKNILGGWKYVNKKTGAMFTDSNISKSIDKMLSCRFSPQKTFLSDHGFEKSARQLADFGREHLKSFRGCKMACFSGLSHVLEEYI